MPVTTAAITTAAITIAATYTDEIPDEDESIFRSRQNLAIVAADDAFDSVLRVLVTCVSEDLNINLCYVATITVAVKQTRITILNTTDLSSIKILRLNRKQPLKINSSYFN